ncbi:MAG: phenylalanine--tRNA ligase subunit beta, partial [Planctomycetota bacterium]
LQRPDRVLERVGVVGEFAPAALQRFDLAGPVSGAEMRLDRLDFAVAAEPKVQRPSDYPAVQRDLNLVVDQAVAWGEIAAAVRDAAGELLEDCRLVQVWEDAERLGAGRKSFVIALRLRSNAGTLSSDATRGAVEQIVAACNARCGAALRG